MEPATIDELLGRLSAAKTAITSARAKALTAPGPADQAAAILIAGAARIAGLSNAVALLCRYGQTAPAAPLVRTMVVTALAMCWAVSAKHIGEALEAETGALEAWAPEEAADAEPDKIEVEGLTDAEAEAAGAVLKRVALAGAPSAGAPGTEEVLAAAGRAMTAAQWALEKRWPAAFPALPS